MFASAPVQGEQLAEVVRPGVVALQVGDNTTGFGVVVGEEAGRLIIVTANHVVRTNDGKPLGRIDVRFYGLPGVTTTGSLLPKLLQRVDVAVIETPTPSGFSWRPDVLARSDSLQPGDRVWSVGRKADWIIQAVAGAFRQRDIDNILRLEHLGVTTGSSGSPVVAEKGLVGILVSDEDDLDTRAVPIETIENAFSPQNWNLPWSLRSALKRKRFEVFADCSDCPEMVVIPGGSFVMGSEPGVPWPDPYSQPAHQVSIGYDFAVSRYEITNQQWLACVRGGGCSRDGGGTIDPNTRFPIEFVNWQDAHDFASWLSNTTGKKYRLLSEAEWEYAMRGGRNDTYPWGASMVSDAAVCWGCAGPYDGARTKSVAPIGRYPSNSFKLYDLAGNVSEIVEDCWFDNYEDAPTDGRPRTAEGCADRVTRGGSYLDPPLSLRVFARSRYQNGGDRSQSVGFRIARDLEN
jgi:formylglycine-generating enzyme required for sulfatase activity